MSLLLNNLKAIKTSLTLPPSHPKSIPFSFLCFVITYGLSIQIQMRRDEETLREQNTDTLPLLFRHSER